MSPRRALVSAVAVLTCLVLAAQPAAAQDPNRVFAGQIITMVKRPPASAKSPDAYISAMRKLKVSNFYEDKTDHTWTVWMAAFLKSPLNDLEYSVKYYDVSNGRGQQLIATDDQFTDTRGQKTLITKAHLDKQMFGVNKELLVTLESKGKVLASARIKILGEGEKMTGKVNFSDDDAKGDDDADDSAKKK
ncbi:MAG TPA: hypothetical protein VGF94_10345 [Kofleriaceae bacterium]|jgi:hypothetical protein